MEQWWTAVAVTWAGSTARSRPVIISATEEYHSTSEISEEKFETIRGIGRSFGYNRNEGLDDYLSIEDIVSTFVDIVSKNGVLLLNISPQADGTIPADQQNVLLTMGEWLSKYGEAIYETRPWYTFGEGPTKEPEGPFSNHREFLKIKYSAKDVRYSTKGDTVYATILGWPGSSTKVLFESFSKENWIDTKEIKNVSLLGCEEKIQYSLTGGGLMVTTPAKVVDEMAVVFKIELK